MYNNNPFYGINALNTLSIDEIIIYLRKSRQDDPNETVEEVLARHEMLLQEYAMRTFGAKIPQNNIYREIVSGETIDDRPEIKKVLDRIQDKKIKAVLVVEVSRLTRGDMLDLGTMVHVLRYTSTLCVTPDRFYDLEDKHHRRAFEDELRRGGDYLEYTKEILIRGRRLSTMQGYWVQSKAPFGYDREQQPNKKYILVPNENASHVRMIFVWFAEGVTQYEIKKRLNRAGVKTPNKKTLSWSTTSIKKILANDVYIGIVRYGEMKEIKVYEDGKLKKKRVRAPESEHVVAKGLHDPIIPLDLWERVQERLGKCDRTNSNHDLVNPAAGLIFCKRCGRAMIRTNIGLSNQRVRLSCSNAPQCDVKSIIFDEFIAAFQDSLRNSVVDVQEKIVSGESSIREAKEAQIAALETRLQKMQDQEDNQYDLLEKKEYTPEVFNRRHSKLVKEMESVRAAIEEARANMPEAVDYEEALIRLHAAIDALDNPDMTPVEVNGILKAIVGRIDYDREKSRKQNNPYELDMHLKL